MARTEMLSLFPIIYVWSQEWTAFHLSIFESHTEQAAMGSESLKWTKVYWIRMADHNVTFNVTL